MTIVFTAKLEAKTWKKIINATAAVIEEVSIEVKPDGLEFTAMDPSHISMLYCFMPKGSFTEYSITEKHFTLGIDVDEVRKIMNRSKPDEILTMKASEDKIILEFSKTDEESVRRFSFSQIDVQLGEKYVVPHLETTSTIRLPAYMFDDAIKDVRLMSNVITFESDPDVFSVSGDGDSGDILIEIKEWLEYDVQQKSKCSFNITYLTDISKILEDEVTIELGSDIPVKLIFALGGAEFLFILAPRVDKEE